MDKIEYFQVAEGGWRWRWRTGNGRVVAYSAETYSTRNKVFRAIERMRIRLSVRHCVVEVEQ